MDAISEAEAKEREVSVTTSLSGASAEIRIGDTGPGIAAGDLQERLRSVFHDKAAGHGHGTCDRPHHCRSASRTDFCGKSVVRRRAFHDQASDRPRSINFGLIRAATLLLRRKHGAAGFLDLYQRTSPPRPDACRDEPKGGCDVSLRQDPDRARVADGESRRRLGPNGRQSAGSKRYGATGQPTAAECRAVEARATRGAGCADCALSRRTAGECAGGIDLSAGGRAGRSLAEGAQDPEGRCVEDGGREAVVGQQRQGAGQHRQTSFR